MPGFWNYFSCSKTVNYAALCCKLSDNLKIVCVILLVIYTEFLMNLKSVCPKLWRIQSSVHHWTYQAIAIVISSLLVPLVFPPLATLVIVRLDSTQYPISFWHGGIHYSFPWGGGICSVNAPWQDHGGRQWTFCAHLYMSCITRVAVWYFPISAWMWFRRR